MKLQERERPHEGQASNSSRDPIFNRCVTARFKLVPVRASQGCLPRGGDKAALLASCTFSIASIYFSRSSWLSVPVLETSNWSNCSMNGRKLSHESGCRTARRQELRGNGSKKPVETQKVVVVVVVAVGGDGGDGGDGGGGGGGGGGAVVGVAVGVASRGPWRTHHHSHHELELVDARAVLFARFLSSAMICSRLGGSVMILACWSCPLRSARRSSMVAAAPPATRPGRGGGLAEARIGC